MAALRAGIVDDAYTMATAVNAPQRRVLIVDLNNFASFPTLAVGILIASIRNAGFDAQLICPLVHDVPATVRERRENLRHHLARRIHLSTFTPVVKIRNFLRQARFRWNNRPHPRVIREVKRALRAHPEILLLSAYLQHHQTVEKIGRIAAAKGVPILLGGPVFNFPDTSDVWRKIPGLVAVVGSEADLDIPDLITAAIDGKDLLAFGGVTLPDGRKSKPAPPLRGLDRVPVPDFNDFPWDRYPTRIIPVMTGRGCQWNRCTFCSDIVSVSGRTFRTRGLDTVMHELREQARRHMTNNFLFLDLKLNSNPSMFRGICSEIQANVPGAQWIGTVHVDTRRDNGLSRADLKAAVASGMRRVSFGLESGSQRLLDMFDKGSTVDANSEFIRNSFAAGLSVRCTMFKGFPGETAEDLRLTADFLEAHAQYLDRVRFNEFSLIEGTPVYNDVLSASGLYPALTDAHKDRPQAKAYYRHKDGGHPDYRRQKRRVLAAVYAINKRPLRPQAQAFDGLM